MSNQQDEYYMQRALELAREGLGRVWPNPSVGCVIVKGGLVIGEARTQDGGRPHAEEFILAQLGEKARGATAYVTLEPCNHDRDPKPCSQNLTDAGVSRVAVACLDPDPRTAGEGIARLKAAGIEVVTDVREREAMELNRGFFKLQRYGIPFVTLKQAVSADGMVSSGPGQRTQISGAQAHKYLHLLRSTFDAVGVGIGTVLADDPLLTVRLEDRSHEIVRVVFDSKLRIPVESKLVQTAGHDPVWVCYQDDPEGRAKALEDLGVKLLHTSGSVQSGLQALGRAGITRLMIEGGPKLHDAFIREGLVDEMQVLYSSKTFAQGLRGADFTALGFETVECRELGQDLLEILRPAA